MTTYLFPELQDRRVRNGDRIRLSSLRWIQRALQRMYEDSGYWHGDGYIDKTTGENVFSRLTWHIVATEDDTITVTPVDTSEDCRNRCMFSYSYAGEGGSSRIHGARFGTVAPGDRLQISFPSVWAIGHNAVIRKVEFVGNNAMKLTLDRSTDGVKNSTHSRYKIGTEFEIYHATITDRSYTDGAGATRWTTDATWAIDGALVVTTTRRIIPHSWFQISPRTKPHGCKFCLCDHSNSVCDIADDGVAIDDDGRHWYCAKRRYFVETYTPYPEGESYGGGQFTYTWHTPSKLDEFEADCLRCGGDCDQYADSFDDGTGAPKNWSYVDETIHMCRILDDYWQSVPCYLEIFLQPPAPAIFRYECTGTPSILAQKRIPGILTLHPDRYTTKTAPMGKWSNATFLGGSITLSSGGTFTVADDNFEPTYGLGARIKSFTKSGRGGCDFSKGTPVALHQKKPRKTLCTRTIDEVELECSDGTGRIFLKQKRLCVTVGFQRWTFDASGGAGFYLPNSMQPNNGEDQSYGSEWGGVRKYDNAIIAQSEAHGRILFQVFGASSGDGADSPQHWHLVHETYDSELDVWLIDSEQNDVDEAPPAALFSGATDAEIALKMRYRDAIVLPVEEDRDIDYSIINSGDSVTFERAGI